MKLNINFDTYLELEKISNGSFAPLNGFMEEKDFYSVSSEALESKAADSNTRVMFILIFLLELCQECWILHGVLSRTLRVHDWRCGVCSHTGCH